MRLSGRWTCAHRRGSGRRTEARAGSRGRRSARRPWNDGGRSSLSPPPTRTSGTIPTNPVRPALIFSVTTPGKEGSNPAGHLRRVRRIATIPTAIADAPSPARFSFSLSTAGPTGMRHASTAMTFFGSTWTHRDGSPPAGDPSGDPSAPAPPTSARATASGTFPGPGRIPNRGTFRKSESGAGRTTDREGCREGGRGNYC